MASSLGEKGRGTDYKGKLAASVKFYSLKNMGGGLHVFTGGDAGSIPGQILQAVEWRGKQPKRRCEGNKDSKLLGC